MFFTRFGLIIAWLVVAVFSVRLVTAIFVAFLQDQALARRYLGSSATGDVIDASMVWILVGVGLGVVAELSRTVARIASTKD